MDTYVINLDRSIDRWRTFEALNHLVRERLLRMSGVDGRTLARGDLLARGLIAADLDYGDGALGAALSHLALWELALEQNRPLTICEDDSVFNRNFWTASEALVQQLGADWDLVLWGWNFDSILAFELIPGVSRCVGTFNQDALRNGILAFQAADVRPLLFRLYHAFGSVSYSVSPRGARALRRFCLPLRPMQIPVPGLGRVLPNIDLSVMMNALYARINAFVSFPPLVVTPNDAAVSTIRRRPDLP